MEDFFHEMIVAVRTIEDLFKHPRKRVPSHECLYRVHMFFIHIYAMWCSQALPTLNAFPRLGMRAVVCALRVMRDLEACSTEYKELMTPNLSVAMRTASEGIRVHMAPRLSQQPSPGEHYSDQDSVLVLPVLNFSRGTSCNLQRIALSDRVASWILLKPTTNSEIMMLS